MKTDQSTRPAALPPTASADPGHAARGAACGATFDVVAHVTKGVALGSLVLAIAVAAWLARASWPPLPLAVGLAAAAGLLGGRHAPGRVAAVILFCTYLTPAAFALFLGRFRPELLLVWSAALTGLIAGDRCRWHWAYPHAWRFALVLWALTVAVAWPITALREADFESLVLLHRYNIPNTAAGGPPRLMILWTAEAAIVHLLGLLWFNWLFQQTKEARPLVRSVLWPLASGTIPASLLALYQGFVDLTFLSGGLWPSMQRAAGSLVDANAFGMVTALWTAGFVALSFEPVGHRAVLMAGAGMCWAGVWMSGSRSALAAAGVALGLTLLAAMRHRRSVPRALAVAGGAAAIALLAALLGSQPASESPLRRIRHTLPSELTRPAVAAFVREMWNRNGYGAAATALIAEHPATGVGMGLFNLSGSAYVRAQGGHLAPDNAQNWWRHHAAELGFIGASGLLLWTALFVAFLARTGGDGPRRIPAVAVKGALIGVGMASLVGMPAQNLAVTVTVWTFAFWYSRLVRAAPPTPLARLGPRAWTVLLAIVTVNGGMLLVLARGDDRPAERAAKGGWRYTYGMYDAPGAPPAGEVLKWTERHGVAVVPAGSSWMVLSVRADHPDLHGRPVRARLAINGVTVVEQFLHTSAPVTRAVAVGPGPRVIVEARVDRTWRRADAPADPDVGLALQWRFVPEPPPGLRTVSAPSRR